MYGKVISSNGEIIFENDEIEKEISLEHSVKFLSIYIASTCEVFLNDDTDSIYLNIAMTQPFILRDIPIWKFKIKRAGHSLFPNSDGQRPELSFTYYGFY